LPVNINSFPKIPSEQIRAVRLNQRIIGGDGLRFLQLLALFVVNLFWSRRWLEVESLFLRHQLNIALRRAPQCRRLRGSDRALLVWMPWLWPTCSVCPASARHDPAMASSRVSSLLALEISRSVRRPRVSVELRKSSIASDLTYDLRSGDPDFIDKLVALTFGNRSAFFAPSAATPGLPRSIPQ
jgi:hypothetical protein